jgi:hypothetical protein
VAFSFIAVEARADDSRFVVRTLGAPCNAINHVHHASRRALGRANTKGVALCRAPHHVAASHAISAVSDSCLAGTNARESAARHVLKNTARFVRIDKVLEWIFLR